MDILVYFLACLVVCFGFVLLFGAPYLPTKKNQIEAALSLMNVKKGDCFIELGCGDGRVLRAAAKKGIRGVGYEINPLLYLIARVSLFKYRKITEVKFQNYWTCSWPKASAVYVFLLDKYMTRLDKKLVDYSKQNNSLVTLVSFAFKIPVKKIKSSKYGLFVYEYK